MKKRIIIALLILNTLGLSLIASKVNWEKFFRERRDEPHAKQFKNDLIEALEKADRVEIIEHSNYSDLLEHFPEDDFRDIPEFDYLNITLDSNQLARLKELVKNMPTRPTTIPLPGFYPPHHSIKIYEGDELKHYLRIDFAWRKTDWFLQNPARNNPNTWAPVSFFIQIKDFFEEFGFQPDRTHQEWVALALEKRKEHQAD